MGASAAVPLAVGMHRSRSAWVPPAASYGKQFQGPQQLPGGLRYLPSFVSSAEEAELLEVLDGSGSRWERHIRRAQQFFGLVYYQTTHSVPELQPTSSSTRSKQLGRPLQDLPAWLFQRLHGEGLFTGRHGSSMANQVQGNEYLGDSGIGLHVEDPAAGETLATISLLQPIQFTLQRAVEGRPMRREERHPEDYIKILLEPRSLLVLEGESRHEFAHAIRQSRLVHLRDGGVLRRSSDYRRVSLTCRQILEEHRTQQRQDTPKGFLAYRVEFPTGG